MQVAYQFAKLSYANRKKVGAVIIKDEQMISFGYNGTPHGFDNNCETHDNKTAKTVLHAESNALMKLTKSTMSSNDSDLYVTMSPCHDCAKLIIQAGVKKVYYAEEYRDSTGIDLLEKAGIPCEELITWNSYE